MGKKKCEVSEKKFNDDWRKKKSVCSRLVTVVLLRWIHSELSTPTGLTLFLIQVFLIWFRK
jgi:hypothetical protein